MKRKVKHAIVLLLIFPFIIQVSCKKENNKSDEDKLEEIAVGTLNGTSYGFLVIPNTEISGSTNTAKINDKVIKLIKLEDQEIGLFLPNLPEGSYALTVDEEIWKVNVKNQKNVQPALTIDPIFERIEEKFKLITLKDGFQENELNEMMAFKDEVIKLYNSLTPSQKEEVAQYYVANKNQIEVLSKSAIALGGVQTPQLLAASTSNNNQNNCSSLNTFNEYYNCQCAAQSAAYHQMAPQLRTALKMLAGAGAVAGVSLSLSALGPAALGIAAVGISLPLAAAMYIIFVEIGPDIKDWLIATRQIIASPWIMRDDLFANVSKAFKDETDLDLNLQLGYRTLKPSDADAVPNSNAFLSVYQSASTIWSKITSLVGPLPLFSDSQNRTPLKNGELVISEISNNSVRLLRQNKGILTFKSSDAVDHDFSFVATVTAEGFTKKATLQATITSKDSSDIYKNSLVGTYRIQNYKGNSATSELYVDITLDGKATYRIYKDMSWADGTKFNASWDIKKENGKYYYYETGFFHHGFGFYEPTLPLSYPVNSFRFHNDTFYTK